eukprot:15268128-Ditylum_brightwellii.AAC.1
MSESHWELPYESSTMPSSFQQPSNDANTNAETQPQSQPVDEQVALSPVLSPSLPTSSQIPTVNKGENVNPKGEEMANSIPEQEKQEIQMPKMIDLSSTGLRSSTRNRRAPERFGFLTMLLGVSTALYTNISTVPLTVQNQVIFHSEVPTALFDDTINCFSHMAFAANQQQNEAYTYKDMLKQPDCKKFVAAMLEEIAVHKGRNH